MKTDIIYRPQIFDNYFILVKASKSASTHYYLYIVINVGFCILWLAKTVSHFPLACFAHILPGNIHSVLMAFSESNIGLLFACYFIAKRAN